MDVRYAFFDRGFVWKQLTVRGGGHRQTLCANLEWEDLASHNPSDRSPGRCEEEDEDADESNGGLLRGNIFDNRYTRIILTQGCRTEDRNEELRDGHTDGTPEEKWTSTPFVNGVKTWKGGGHVDS